MSRPREARLLAAVLLAGCASRGGLPLAPLSAPDARTEWTQLQAADRSLAGARSLLHVRVESGGEIQSFRAIFRTDPSRRVLIDVLSPIGTTAFTLFLDGTATLLVDRIHGTYRRGTAASFASALPILALGSSRRIAALLLGLPVAEGTAREEGANLVVSGSGSETLVTPAGISRVTLRDASVDAVADYERPAFPASGVRITSGSVQPFVVDITVADVESDTGRIDVPHVEGYAEERVP